MRLGKYLAHGGVASRRAAEQLVFDGRVTVGGSPVTDPARDVGEADDVRVDGRKVSAKEPQRLVYAVHKPEGVVSTAKDPQGRPTVVDLIGSDERLYPVGRLDIDTTGLILLTNDGDLANRLTHPRYGVEKTYRVTVTKAPIKGSAIDKLRDGLELDDGPTLPAKVRRHGVDGLEIVIREGRKRQVRRMVEAVGHRVKTLQRVKLGPLELGNLHPGDHRRLRANEVQALRDAAQPPRRPQRDRRRR
jgi:23S rRNA pseudouridine2605 synthase